MDPFVFGQFPSRVGALGMAGLNTPGGLRVIRIYLPNELPPSFPSIKGIPRSPFTELAERIQAYLAGEAVPFDLDILLMDQCTEFQQKVLLAEFGIPRGWVSTYARVAAHLQAPQAARAVGNTLATNPFPIVIPCHRAVHSDGSLGGYRGGLALKRTLLEMEGVAFESENKVRLDKVWY